MIALEINQEAPCLVADAPQDMLGERGRKDGVGERSEVPTPLENILVLDPLDELVVPAPGTLDLEVRAEWQLQRRSWLEVGAVLSNRMLRS